MTEVLELADVVKSYPGHPPVHALAGVSLTVHEGELVGIVGPSGSGKSTLLHIIGTLDRPSSGVVTIGGHVVSTMSDRRLSAARSSLIGFVFQQFHLIPSMTALDNVATGLLYTGANLTERRFKAFEALQRVGLAHRLTHLPSELSGGERQRVAIARALVNKPAIILADEPTGNLDTHTGEQIMGLFHDLNAQGATILVITHDRELAEGLPRQVHIRDGRLESDSAATVAA
ncbi:ABC transporter ATP-binding protein [Demequina lutea]|uniref:Putative ABC transport system ATP-binding protein n=1 Tax=Demequina lutea TaxID=431489 RepID=A0A7Y9ZB39_9MICO|nr:ABC transporter ATP-binding protein [Demequina lutea]NYI40061.1 putative ABC transport system ATP-binding protein [Demequina lutea]